MSKIQWQDSCIDNVIATREQQTLDALRAELRAMVTEEERVTDDTTNAIGERECGVCGSTLHDLYNCPDSKHF